MKTSFWRRWCDSLRSARSTRPILRGRRRRPPLGLEALEDRVTPTLTPQMVLDIDATELGWIRSEIVAVGSVAYFAAVDGLWKSDGTAAGTVVVTDMPSGTLTNVNGTLYFTADDGTNGWELWKSDGTTAGTVLVKDINPGSASSYFHSLTAVNGTLFFSVNDGTIGDEFWKSDGTAAGTAPVKDIYPGLNSSGPRNLTNVNGTLFFSAEDGTTGGLGGNAGGELWKSDGTAAGTVLVKDINPGGDSSGPRNLTNVNGTLFFSAYNPTTSVELWKSDGTGAGTVLVKDIFPGGASSGAYSDPKNLTNVNGTLFFTANDGTHGTELWKSNGTAAGTVLVKDIYPVGARSWFEDLTNVNGTLFFLAVDSTTGGELWKSDGTAAGTVLVKDIYPGFVSSWPMYLTTVNGTLFFLAYDGTTSGEVWKSDGTAAGTVLVKDINPGSASSHPTSLVNVNGTLFFVADDGTHGSELWKSDGTAAGTTLVYDIHRKTYGSAVSNPVSMNGTLYFTAFDGTHGLELWKSDGSAAGTVLVKDINPGSASSEIRNLTAVNGTLYFAANDGTTGVELWKSDGTAAGTTLVKDIFPGSRTYQDYWGNWHYNVLNNSSPGNLTNVNGTLFFTATDGTTGGLWKSDGTAAGTALVRSWASNLTDVNGTLFFASGDANGTELWKSDGTAAGTTLVKDIYPGSTRVYDGYGGWWDFPNSSYASNLTNVNGTLFFTAYDGTTGQELWRSDGTAAGTVQVKDINPGSAGSSPSNLTAVNGTLFFTANDGTGVRKLWQSDGTAAGTVLVKDINPGSALMNVNGTVYFTANNGTTGLELWKSDGTAAGTVLVKDINPGSASSDPRNLTAVNGTLFFTANDGTGVWKLWQSDGTAAGTVVVTDMPSGTLTNVNGTLFFSADDGFHGYELWRLVDDGLPSLTIGNVTVTEGHAGTQSATFTVTLFAAAGQPVTVAYTTANASAIAGSDYQAASGTLTFAPGETSKIITVLVNGDRLGEPNETFLVNLIAPTNASFGDSQGVGTIVDDEPRLSIGDGTVIEGNIGTRAATFTVTLSAASSEPVTVAYATANASAAAGSDYQAASGTLTIPAGQTTGTITVLVNGDRLPEASESFFVNLSSPTNAYIVDSQGIGTILDDEPRISISDVTRAEGKNRQTTLFVFTVTLSAAYDQPVTMSFATDNGTATTSNNDYVAKTGTLTFAPGETTKTITIEVRGDNRKEAAEMFYLDLSGLSGNALFTKNRGIGTILNDD